MTFLNVMVRIFQFPLFFLLADHLPFVSGILAEVIVSTCNVCYINCLKMAEAASKRYSLEEVNGILADSSLDVGDLNNDSDSNTDYSMNDSYVRGSASDLEENELSNASDNSDLDHSGNNKQQK